jgi:copine 5/8/9
VCGYQDSFGKSDPFLRVSRLNEDGSTIPVFKTEVVKDNLNPVWRGIQQSLQRLCNGDPYRPLLLECFDWDSDGSHDLIGTAQSSADDILKRYGSLQG